MTDEELIALFEKRDETAIEYTAAQYGARLLCLANRIVHDAGSAEECVNDTYFKAWNAIPPAHPTHMGAYLSRITRHNAFSVLKKEHAQKRSAEIVSLTDELTQCIPDRTQENISSKTEFRDCMNSFLTTLSVQSRRVFLRRYWYADSIHDIAVRYRMSESSVKVTLYRTREKLRVFLEKEDV